eukprot:4501855-Amphidinium_carterae.1
MATVSHSEKRIDSVQAPQDTASAIGGPNQHAISRPKISGRSNYSTTEQHLNKVERTTERIDLVQHRPMHCSHVRRAHAIARRVTCKLVILGANGNDGFLHSTKADAERALGKRMEQQHAVQ